jgi:glycerol-3-phosphate acyltransferase PlsY
MSDVGLPPSFDYVILGLLAAMLVCAYVIGSIPFGYLFARFRGGVVAGLALDAAKGFAPVLAVHMLAQRLDDPITNWFVAAFAAAILLGDCFSPWLRFKGGKGVATSLGAILGFCWPAALIAAAVWIAGALLVRYPSVTSVAGSLVATIAIWFFTASPALTLYGVFAGLLIVLVRNRNYGKAAPS